MSDFLWWWQQAKHTKQARGNDAVMNTHSYLFHRPWACTEFDWKICLAVLLNMYILTCSFTEKLHHHFTSLVGGQTKSLRSGARLVSRCNYHHITVIFPKNALCLCFLSVWRDRRREPHYRRSLPPEVCSLQLLLQRCGPEGEKKQKSLTFYQHLCL